MGGEREREPKYGREPGAEIARPEKPDRHREPFAWDRLHAPAETARPEVADELEEVVGKRVGALWTTSPQGHHRRPVAAWGAAKPQIDPTRVERLERPELLGDHERGVVRQHDTARTHSDGRGAASDVRDEHGGCRAATPGMPWCSASQNRRYPQASTCRARSSVFLKDSAAVPPSRMGERSSTDTGILRDVLTLSDSNRDVAGRVTRSDRNL